MTPSLQKEIETLVDEFEENNSMVIVLKQAQDFHAPQFDLVMKLIRHSLLPIIANHAREEVIEEMERKIIRRVGITIDKPDRVAVYPEHHPLAEESVNMYLKKADVLVFLSDMKQEGV